MAPEHHDTYGADNRLLSPAPSVIQSPARTKLT